MLPGELFNRERLIRSYQNIANLDFFQQPMPPPDRRSGTEWRRRRHHLPRGREAHRQHQFRRLASGRGPVSAASSGSRSPTFSAAASTASSSGSSAEHHRLPAELHRSDPVRQPDVGHGDRCTTRSLRYVVGDLGQQHSTGGSVQIGMPFFGSRYSRVFASYGLQHVRYIERSTDLQACVPAARHAPVRRLACRSSVIRGSACRSRWPET